MKINRLMYLYQDRNCFSMIYMYRFLLVVFALCCCFYLLFYSDLFDVTRYLYIQLPFLFCLGRSRCRHASPEVRFGRKCFTGLFSFCLPTYLYFTGFVLYGEVFTLVRLYIFLYFMYFKLQKHLFSD